MKKLGKVLIGVGFVAIGVPLVVAILNALITSSFLDIRFLSRGIRRLMGLSWVNVADFPQMLWSIMIARWLAGVTVYSGNSFLSKFIFLFLPNVVIISGFTILINQSQKIAIKKCFNMLVIIGLVLNILVLLKFFGLYSLAYRYVVMSDFFMWLLINFVSPFDRIVCFVSLLILYIIPVLPTFIITAGYSKFFEEEETESSKSVSIFDGGLLSLIGWILLGVLVTAATLGICFPWAVCMVYGWKARHTTIDGKRLKFNGTAISLFGHWILWLFLTVITFGIYGWWLSIALKKWIVKHTSFDESDNKESSFDGGLLSLIGWRILGFLVTVCTFGICYPWALCMIYGWEVNHSVIEGKREKFHGKAVSLFGHWILWLFLTIITFGIFALWLPIFLERWKVKNTTFEGTGDSGGINTTIARKPTKRCSRCKKEVDEGYSVCPHCGTGTLEDIPAE